MKKSSSSTSFTSSGNDSSGDLVAFAAPSNVEEDGNSSSTLTGSTGATGSAGATGSGSGGSWTTWALDSISKSAEAAVSGEDVNTTTGTKVRIHSKDMADPLPTYSAKPTGTEASKAPVASVSLKTTPTTTVNWTEDDDLDDLLIDDSDEEQPSSGNVSGGMVGGLSQPSTTTASVNPMKAMLPSTNVRAAVADVSSLEAMLTPPVIAKPPAAPTTGLAAQTTGLPPKPISTTGLVVAPMKGKTGTLGSKRTKGTTKKLISTTVDDDWGSDDF